MSNFFSAAVRSLAVGGATYFLVVNVLDRSGMRVEGTRPAFESWSAIAAAGLIGVIVFWRTARGWSESDDDDSLPDSVPDGNGLGDIDFDGL